MSTSTEQFFDALADGAPKPVLGSARGTIRFDLADGASVEHWYVTLRDGTVTVTRSDAPADCVISAEREQFDAVASGEANALAAVLRGVVRIQGDPAPLVRFQRLFPAAERMPVASGARSVGRRRG